MLALAAPAGAEPGQIGYDGCLGDDAAQLCADLPGAPLDAAVGIAVSPDGRSVYVASQDSGAIAQFTRNGPGGQIVYNGCLSNGPGPRCRALARAPLVGASGVAVSPDGRSVYVVSASSDSIAQFSRRATGRLTYVGCFANDSAQGCEDLPGAPLSSAFGVTVSPDGRSVFVVSLSSNSIAQFSRTGSTARLTYAGCLANTSTQFCRDLPGSPLTGAAAVAVSPDGRTVYVASSRSNAIARFARRGADLPITYAGCLADDATPLCTALPGSPLTGAAGVAVSPDGTSVYVASAGSNAIARFVRGGSRGGLTYGGCLANHAAPRCRDLPGAPLGGATGVTVSPDGQSVYVASSGSNAITHFARSGATGQLTYGGCLADNASRLCGDLPGSPLGGAIGVAVSPGGDSVYVASTAGDAVAHFFRALGPDPAPGLVVTAGSAPAAG